MNLQIAIFRCQVGTGESSRICSNKKQAASKELLNRLSNLSMSLKLVLNDVKQNPRKTCDDWLAHAAYQKPASITWWRTAQVAKPSANEARNGRANCLGNSFNFASWWLELALAPYKMLFFASLATVCWVLHFGRSSHQQSVSKSRGYDFIYEYSLWSCSRWGSTSWSIRQLSDSLFVLCHDLVWICLNYIS